MNNEFEAKAIPKELPLGVLRCTYEKYPRVIYANEAMQRMLNVPGNGYEWENYKSGNVFFMLPLSERRKFRTDLKLIENSEKPVKMIHRFICCNERQVRLEGWGSMEPSADGGKEYCFVYGEAPEDESEPIWSDSLFRTLRDAYDILFELDLARDTLECIHTSMKNERRSLYRIKMQIAGGMQYLLDKYVDPADHPGVEDFYRDILKMQGKDSGNNPSAEIRLRDARKQLKNYFMTATHVNSSVVFICLKDETGKRGHEEHEKKLRLLESELNHLDSVISRYVLGIFSFRYENALIYPLFATGSAMSFLKCTDDELIRKINVGIPVNEVLKRSGVSSEEFAQLISEGSVQLYLSEKDTGMKWRVRAVCRNFIPEQLEIYDIIVLDDRENGISDIVTRIIPSRRPETDEMIPESVLKNAPEAADGAGTEKRIHIRTFGFFEIFVDGSPISFRHEKSKEMLALLVDRRGGFMTAAEMVSYLWEDEPADRQVLARCRKTAMYLKRELAEYGIDDIIDISNGKRRIKPEKVNCDLYDFLTGRGSGKQGFHGTYMKNYSWGEATLSELLGTDE